jgi:hypothetical protein
VGARAGAQVEARDRAYQEREAHDVKRLDRRVEPERAAQELAEAGLLERQRPGRPVRGQVVGLQD